MKTFTSTGGLLSLAAVQLVSALPTNNKCRSANTTVAASSCALPSSYQWTDFGGPLATPDNGWVSLKDFTVSSYNGNHVVYGSYYSGSAYGSMGEQSPCPCALSAIALLVATNSIRHLLT